jgi:type I restriction enzyme M protein
MMLDTQTKSKIDSARDILVGKVPDPKSQVEQITIALIYKFMDDMDRQSEELGGKATFFTGEFKKYRWANLLDKRLSGHERLNLYTEGLDRMNTNKNIPQLFRDIFKGVFLPYRDPETLNLFLKEIAGFTYEHSERLGDAYEYLLSVLGTQGDAGQFRTPRHIIDFIVAVVDPKKHETILDPACGTAGFLISAFKHIVRNNKNLTPDERARLMTNFRGYDIAPDMVRLSRVNLYLHGFPNPVIHEYDALTSEERWDERCDVIMANPPFMTPKGGIRPHNRFSIKAKRSEVLFVDYIAEHLNPSGRAGIIVPEGIIFQSQNAYKRLRLMLVENYLWAVVSLPAGVFNPYSGVKTSILFLDRNLARRTDEILFVKVENDGFDLGAQRRPIDGDDLPEALRILDGHKKAQQSQEGKIALTVSRKRLLESGDINLSGDRYREIAAVQSKWPMVRVEDVVEVLDSLRRPVKEADRRPGPFPYYGAMGIVDYVDEYLFDEELVLVGEDGAKWGPHEGKAFVVRGKIWVNNHAHVLRPKTDTVMAEYLASVLDAADLQLHISGLTVPKLTQAKLRTITIPLPPLDVQRQMVTELDGYRKIIEGARQVIANYKPTIKIDPKWPRVKLGEVIRTITPPKKIQKAKFGKAGMYPIIDQSQDEIAGWTDDSTATVNVAKPVVIFGDHTCAVKYTERPFVQGADGIKILETRDSLQPRFLFYWLKTFPIQSDGYKRHFSKLVETVIPLPPLEIQRRIVAELEAERAMVEANRKLAEIWGGGDDSRKEAQETPGRDLPKSERGSVHAR